MRSYTTSGVTHAQYIDIFCIYTDMYCEGIDLVHIFPILSVSLILIKLVLHVKTVFFVYSELDGGNKARFA